MKRYNKTPNFSFTYISGGEHTGHYTESGYIGSRIYQLKNKGIGLFITKEILNSLPCYLCPVIKEGKIGFINSFADIIIIPQYDDFVGEFTSPESLITVCKENKWGILNANGIEFLMGEFQRISLIGTQYAIVMDSEYKKGIIEVMTKRMTIPFGEYDDFNYYDSLLIARKKQLKGLITPTGKLITPVKYKWISCVEYGLLRVIIEENIDGEITQKWGIIDTLGSEILPTIYDRISPVRSEGKVIYADKKDKSIKFNIENLTQRTNIE